MNVSWHDKNTRSVMNREDRNEKQKKAKGKLWALQLTGVKLDIITCM